jgi:competence protein ComEC
MRNQPLENERTHKAKVTSNFKKRLGVIELKNKGVFYAISGLIGVLAAFQDFLVYFIILKLYLFFLLSRKKFNFWQVITIYLLFFFLFMRAEIDINQNKTSFLGNEKTFYLVLEEAGKMDGDLLTVNATDMQNKETLFLKYRMQSEEEKKRLNHDFTPG